MRLAETKSAAPVVELRNILLATDFSPSSLAAVPHVAAIARRYESKIYLMHVVVPDAYPLVSPEAAAWTTVEMDEGAKGQLERLSSSKELEGIPHEALLLNGEVTEALTAAVSRHDIDLVIVGTHGRRGFRRLLMGSVAEGIFRSLPCPVLTVGPHVSGKALEELALKRILYPTDLSATSFRAARYAISFALEYAAHLTVLHVLAPQAAAPFETRLAADAFQHEMQTLVSSEARPWCDLESVIEPGDPAETILRAAKERGADLIVLGVRQAEPVSTHRAGNIAYRIVAEAECPVLTVST
jgi:nucleotide-binding universal stress UspA family protein